MLALVNCHGVVAWLVGGWAEEPLRGARPWPHSDVDLLCAPGDEGRVDALLAAEGLVEVVAKRRPGKRAFVLDGVLVEIHLAEERRGTAVRG